MVCRSLLVKNGFGLVFESEKILSTKNDQFISKGHVAKGLLKMKVMPMLKTFESNKSLPFVYILEFSSLWHGKLGYVNQAFLRKLDDLGFIPKLYSEDKRKYYICVEVKFAKKLFSMAKESSKPLKLYM